MMERPHDQAKEIEFEILRPGEPARQGAGKEDLLARMIALIMDNLFRVPGTNFRFGLDPVIGLIPGVGDASGAVVSIAVLVRGGLRGIPKVVLVRMAVNIAINTLIGAVPVAGDIFSAFFKSNARNYALLLRHSGPGQVSTRGDWFFLLGLVGVLVVLLVLVILGVFFFALMFVRYLQGH